MISRHLYNVIVSRREGYPAILITGPRQSGKTTLARTAAPDLPYINMESPTEQVLFKEDPVGYLSSYPKGAVIDEAQNTPEIFSYLQVRIDEEKKMGRWILTGSQQIELNESVSQSLAGRVSLLELLPFSYEELKAAPEPPKTLPEAILKGGYPPLYDRDRKLEPIDWLDDYLATFVRRDVLNLLAVQKRTQFDVFVRKCASLCGCLINKSELSDVAEIDSGTVDDWLSVLEASYLIRLIRPYHRNFGKRLNKRPKLHFLDTGLACRLLHISNVQQLRDSPQYGGLVESWCFSECLKYFRHQGRSTDLWFWRSSDGIESDLLLERGTELIPIEIKAGETPRLRNRSGVQKLKELNARDTDVTVGSGLVVYGGEQSRSISDVSFVPWNTISQALHGRL